MDANENDPSDSNNRNNEEHNNGDTGEADAGSNRGINIVNNVERDLENANNTRRRNEGTRNNLNPRDRLFYALFMKIGQLYARLVPKKLRILLEIVVLLKGLLLFSFLSYLHFSFGKVPMNCLNSTIGSWPRDGILRVQIQPEYNLEKQLPRFYSRKQNLVLFHPCHNEKKIKSKLCSTLSQDLQEFYKYHDKQYTVKEQCYRMNLSDFMHEQDSYIWKNYENFEYIFSDRRGNLFKGFQPGEIIKEDGLLAFYEKYLSPTEPERHYVFEYAQEFGFLRISQEARNRLNIPVKTISFDPNKEKCFGDTFSRFILKYFLGYDDVLMNSIKKIADAENNTGYMLNVVTGDHYKFVSWGMGRSSYFISLLLMFLFTISISTLLRYCHQQVFFFIIHLLQMMDMNVVLAFPIAPLFTVILSLVGMETIMSEYFNDTTTSFYIILIVWAVDQFDTICCHTEISQKYWLRFFYLYHFIFYSYHYRFNGQYSSIALAATWFLIQHSMLYFLHNYELPAIENGTDNGRRDEDAYLDEAVQMIVEGIEMVAGQQQNNLNHQDAVNREGNDAEEANQANEELQNGEEQANEAQEPFDHMVHRVILLAADTTFLQIFREFVRVILEHINIDRRNPTEPPEGSVENENAGAGESASEAPVEITPQEESATVEDTEDRHPHILPTNIHQSHELASTSQTPQVGLQEEGSAPASQLLKSDASPSKCNCYMQIHHTAQPVDSDTAEPAHSDMECAECGHLETQICAEGCEPSSGNVPVRVLLSKPQSSTECENVLNRMNCNANSTKCNNDNIKPTLQHADENLPISFLQSNEQIENHLLGENADT